MKTIMAFIKRLPYHNIMAKATFRTPSINTAKRSVFENYSCNNELLINRGKSVLSCAAFTNKRPSVNVCFFSTQTDTTDRGYMVYKGRQSELFRALKVVSLSTSAITMAIQPYLLYEAQDMSLAWAVPIFTLVNAFIFVNPLLIHLIAKKYVLEMYFNTDTKVFTAMMLTFFAQKKALTFTAADVEVPDVPSPFSMFKAKGNPLFAFEGDFTSIEVYKHMMGFDRPLDLRYDASPEKKD